MIVYCQGTYDERVPQTLEAFKRLGPHVDRRVVIIDQSVSKEQIAQLHALNIETYYHEWKDDFPAMRNHYLEKCQDGDWIIVSDPDEWFCEQFCKDVRDITINAKKAGIDLLLINSHDICHEGDKIVANNVSDFYKNLVYHYHIGVKYEGCGNAKNVHEILSFPVTPVTRNLDQKYYYEHHKFEWEVWERAARNVYIGGGGNNVGAVNKQWIPLRAITESIGITKWNDLRAYMRKGKIDPRLIKWLNDNRRNGFDWENEMVDMWRWYFKYLHPEENVEKLEPITDLAKDSPQAIMKQIEDLYIKVLGRHGDQFGKESYTEMILFGNMTLQDVEKAMYDSAEYRNKHAVGYKKINNLSAKWARAMRITQKVETGGSGNDRTSQDVLAPRVKMFKEHCPPDKFQKVLDQGAGAGAETALLVKEGYKVFATTYGMDNIRIGHDEYNVTLIEMDMHDLQFPPKTFDAIFTVQAFEHAFSPWLAILEARRVLRDGGRVFVDVPSADCDEWLDTIWHTSVLYPRQWNALFAKAGFKLVADLGTKDNYVLIYEKMPDGTFPTWEYLQHVFAEDAPKEPGFIGDDGVDWSQEARQQNVKGVQETDACPVSSRHCGRAGIAPSRKRTTSTARPRTRGKVG